ncbi:MAG: alpha/beta hydrolase [Clostridia bacterium]
MALLMAVLWCAALLLLLCAVCVTALVRIAAARVIVKHLHKPDRQTHTPWDAYSAEAGREIEWFERQSPEKVEITSFDGLKLRGSYLPAGEEKQAVLLMHGYRAKGGISDFAPLLRFYHELGLSVLVVDQRAHGQSEGKWICYGVKERYDCKQWLEWLNGRAHFADLFLSGLSMGAATVLMATALALPPNVRGVVADCGFTSPWEICGHVLHVQYHLPKWPLLPLANAAVRHAAGYDLREASAVEAMRKDTSIPVLFIHGDQDAFVPTWMGRENYEACAATKVLVIVPGAGHALSVWKASADVQAAISAFVKSSSVQEEAPEC